MTHDVIQRFPSGDFQLFNFYETHSGFCLEWVTKDKEKAEKKRDSEAKTEGTGTQISFNEKGEEQRRRQPLKTQQRNKQTGMQEASHELYSTEEKQAGETEKQDYIPLKKYGN